MLYEGSYGQKGNGSEIDIVPTPMPKLLPMPLATATPGTVRNSTAVSGGIYANTTWDLGKSPYIVTGTVTLFPGCTLTIEPGVQVRFAAGATLIIRGALVAEGTATNRIVFTSDSPAPIKGIWGGIQVATNQGGKVSLKFVTVEYAQTALSVECCWSGGPVNISDSVFTNNVTALGGYAGWDMQVDRSTFEKNTYAVMSADKKISNSVFRDNRYGLYETERVSVYGSTFTGHEVALWGGRGVVKYSTIANNGTGVRAFFEGFTLSNNTITRNTVGVILGQYDSYSSPVSFNNIYGNTIVTGTINMKNTGPSNKDALNNWWGTTDTSVIEAGIYDGRDDPVLGLINYQPFLTEPAPTSLVTTSLSSLATYQSSPSFSVSWSGTSDPDPIASYDVQYRDGGEGAWTDLITATTALSTTFSGQDGHIYSFRARATTTTGVVSDWSDPVSTTVDLTAPTGTLQVQGWSSPYISNTVTLSISASDATSGVSQMQFGPDAQNFSAWELYATTRSYLAPPGATAVYGRFKDNAGNISQPVSATITVDSAPPTGSITINGDAAYANAINATLTLSATDNLSGVSSVAFSNNGSTWSDWQSYGTSKSWALASGADGERTVFTRLRDAAQNVSPVYSDTIILDTTPPGTPQPDDGISGVSNNPRPTFRWPEVTDNLSGLAGYYYKVDSGAEALVLGTAVTLTTQSDGNHTFYVRAKDRAGNYSPYGFHTFSIKTNLPQSPGIIQPQTPTAYDRTVVSGISEQGLTVKLYVNGSFVGQITAGSYGVWNFVNVPLAMGANILTATATDQAGNISLFSTPVVVDRVEVWAPPPAPQASAVISTTGGTVAAGNNVSVTVPSGAFAEEVNLTLTPYATASAPGVFGVVSANAYTSITAVTTASGTRVSSLQQPVTITIAYNPAVLGNVPETSLQISYYDEGTRQWVALPSVVDTVNHTVSASTTHFSLYDAQASLLTKKVYLPLVFKSWGAGW
ncbi:MAG: Ig-like domain-containing protein [Chloroflexi bacterium]|nr:Ig-like domain-containing protein [Chloroflexota bacterium]MCL5074458.1 Ig-like domain-containing protein [Chloroflexota bacterium]